MNFTLSRSIDCDRIIHLLRRFPIFAFIGVRVRTSFIRKSAVKSFRFGLLTLGVSLAALLATAAACDAQPTQQHKAQAHHHHHRYRPIDKEGHKRAGLSRDRNHCNYGCIDSH